VFELGIGSLKNCMKSNSKPDPLLAYTLASPPPEQLVRDLLTQMILAERVQELVDDYGNFEQRYL